MRTAFKSVYETAQRYDTDMRTGAYILAVDRVAEATTRERDISLILLNFVL